MIPVMLLLLSLGSVSVLAALFPARCAGSSARPGHAVRVRRVPRPAAAGRVSAPNRFIGRGVAGGGDGRSRTSPPVRRGTVGERIRPPVGGFPRVC